MRKSFGDTRTSDKPASSRYQVQNDDDDEVDHDEIELRADETLEDLNATEDNKHSAVV